MTTSQISSVTTWHALLNDELLKEELAKELLKLPLDKADNCLPTADVYTSKAAEKPLKMKKEEKQQFFSKPKGVYLEAAQYMQTQLQPLDSQLLRCLSALDPMAQGHSVTHGPFKKLVAFFPIVMSETTHHEMYLREISQLQLDPTLPGADGIPLDHWWASAFSKFPTLAKVVKAALSIFSGPQVELSFSITNDTTDGKSNHIHIDTFSAKQTVKYDLKSRRTSLQRYH